VTNTWPSSRLFFLRGLARAAIVMLVLGVLAVPLAVLSSRANVDCSGHSIVDVELAYTTDRSAEALTGCSTDDVRAALAWDIPFIVLYVAVLAAGAMFVGGSWPAGGLGGYRLQRLRAAGTTLAGVALGVGVLDLLENATLAIGLQDSGGSVSIASPWAEIAATAGWTKFALAAIVLAYIVVGLVGWTAMPTRTMADPTPYVPEEDGGNGDGDGAIGISLSGGGVRAAAFGLGALQVLDQRGIYERARWLSAVSGGSYMAGAWTIARRDPTPVPGWPAPWADPAADGRVPGPGSPEVAYLRSNLKYLLRRDGGLGGAVATLVVGLAVNVASLAVLLWLLARPLGWLIGSWVLTGATATGGPVEYVLAPRYWVPPVAWAAGAVVLVLLWVMLQRLSSLSIAGNTPRLRRVVWLAALASAAASIVLVLVLIAAPAAAAWIPSLIADNQRLLRLVQAATAGGALAAIVAVVRKPLGRIAPRLGGLLVLTLAVLVGSQVAATGAANGATEDLALWLAVLAGFALWYYAADPDWWSIQPFYRARLRSAYATKRAVGDRDGTAAATVERVSAAEEPDLADYRETRPELMVCTTFNVSGDGVRTRVGIPAYSFTFTPSDVRFHVAGATDGACDDFAVATDRYARVFRRWDTPRLTVMTAVGLSGAAVAPGMGRFNMGSTNALLALANIRLGMWMPNPRYVATPAPLPQTPGYPRRRLGYLLKEMVGIYDPDDLYVYVTDGGHWENLGLVELIRRRCAEIYCIDAAGGTADRFATAAEAITLAAQECGVQVEIDLAPLRATMTDSGAVEPADRDCTVGLITYAATDGKPAQQGVLWYVRSSLTKDAPSRLWAYREKNATFPADPTSNQFFDTEKFECYRLLGQHGALHLMELQEAVITRAKGGADLPGTSAATEREHELVGRLHDPRCRTLLGLDRAVAQHA
jgi:hypothetical protein